jgi:peptidoglycan/LPS O-acetylase OafA/YrhL
MKKRLRELDLLRGFITLSVIAIHATGAYAYAGGYPYFWNHLIRYSVPAFIVLSGLVLFHSDRNVYEKPSLGAFFGKRVKRVLIPYIIWSVIYILYAQRHSMKAFIAGGTSSLEYVLQQILSGTAAYHLYFILIILQFYVLYPILRYAFRVWPVYTLAAAFLISAFFHIAAYLEMFSIIILPGFIFPYYMIFPTWLFYFIFGMFIAKNIDTLEMKLDGMKTLLGIIWLAAFAVLLLDSHLTKNIQSIVRPSVILYSLASFMLIYLICARSKESKSYAAKLLDWISSQSFVIYFSHVLFMKLLESFSYVVGTGWLWENTGSAVLVFLCVSAASMLFSYAVSFLPWAGLLGGVPRCVRHERKT